MGFMGVFDYIPHMIEAIWIAIMFQQCNVQLLKTHHAWCATMVCARGESYEKLVPFFFLILNFFQYERRMGNLFSICFTFIFVYQRSGYGCVKVPVISLICFPF